MNLHIYAAGVRAFLRQTSLPLRQQCRSIHLWHAASTQTALGNHGIKALKPAASYTDPAEVEIDLWVAKSGEHIGRITLEKALTEYIKPGTALLPRRPPPEPTDIPRDPTCYHLVDLTTKNPPNVKSKQKRGAKEIHLHTDSTNPTHQQNLLQQAFFMLVKRVKVEFHIHTRKSKKGAKDAIISFAQVQNLVENVSLRPDVIGKALPAYSGTIIEPQDTGYRVCWVVSGTRKKSREAAPRILQASRRQSMSRLMKNQASQKIRDQHGVGMPLKEERNEIKRRLKDGGQWQSFKERREVALRDMQIRDPRVTKMVMKKANPFATPEELLGLFEKGLRIIEPRRKLMAELEAERRDVARQIIRRPHKVSPGEKRQDAMRKNLGPGT